jgi:putative membrane protein
MSRLIKQFNWRFLLVRILVNAIALAVTATVLPKVDFVNKSIWNLLFMAVTLGVLNALVKPVLQALTLHFIVATYGLVIVLVNAVMLLLLSLLFPGRFAVDSLLWALVGGLVLGVLSSFLESLLGLTMPIVSDEPPELRQQLEQKAARMRLPVERHEQGQTPAPSAREGIQIAPGPPTTAKMQQTRETAPSGSGPPEEPTSGQAWGVPPGSDTADPPSLAPAAPTEDSTHPGSDEEDHA